MKQVVALLMIGLSSAAFGISKAYDVVPFGNCVSEIVTIPNNGITQYVRNTLDSLVTASVWVGDTLTSQPYVVDVRDSVTDQRVAYNLNGVHAPKCWAWLDVPLTKYAEPVRGRTYKVIVTRSQGGGISFAYDSLNPYKYGSLTVNGTKRDSWDLALRVYGLHDTVCASDFGVNLPAFPIWSNWTHGNRDTWSERLTETGVGWATVSFEWDAMEATYGTYDFTLTDSVVSCMDPGIEPVGLLVNCPKWASTTNQWYWNDSAKTWYWDSSIHCAPVNLDSGIYSEANYYARWVDAVVDRYGTRISKWLVHNEPNDTCSESIPGVTGWWRRPTRYYQIGSGTRPLCSLYVRLCRVADSVIKVANSRLTDRVFVGNVYKARESHTYLVPGVDWVALCESIAGSVFWDGVAFHAYQEGSLSWFSPDTFARDVDTLRAIMRHHGDYGELWNTEAGWGKDTVDTIESRQQAARNLCQTLVCTEASDASPSGSCERSSWWFFWENNPKWGHEPLVDCAFNRRPSFYTVKQLTATLSGKRLNGRVMTGDTTTDSLVRMYEFEDPADSHKTWVCWRTDRSTLEAAVQLPSRADSAYIEALAYEGGTPPNQMRQANSYGWLGIGATDRPQFITEPANESITRPELAVDTFKAHPSPLRVGEPSSFSVFVRNDGHKSTPGTVQVNIYWNDSLLTTITCDTIPAGESRWASLVGFSIPPWVHGSGLLKAEANPGQVYVEEEGSDDNCGYIRTSSVCSPRGEIGVACGSHSNAPLPLLGFETHSIEADTLGTVPAESARLVQWVYGNDTIVDGGDTTAWFCVNQAVTFDTSWLYLSGQGKYKLFLQVKDSWSESDLIPDTAQPFVIFDTTGPIGSVVINSGARFATSSTCTLALAAYDSASGVGWMRFTNTGRVNLVKNSSFVATAGSWSFANGAYDTSLSMAKLTVGQPQAVVRQFIPAESISAHAGDSCALEASVLAHVHDDEAVGSVSFWHWSTNVNPEVTDTLWQLVDSAGFSGNLLSLTGQHNLSARFLLTEPAPDSEWVWQGGMVKVEASAENGSGNVWCDEVRVQPHEPDSGYFWFAPYDTQAVWDIGPGAGVKIVRALFMDSAGNENATPAADTIILDATAPVVNITVPSPAQLINGVAEVTGWGYDPVEVLGDTWFNARNLYYRHVDSTNWLPVSPDSVSYVPAYPDTLSILGPAVHLGYWNTLALEDGEYYLKLVAADSAGQVSSCSTWVIVLNIGGGGGMRSGPEGGGTGMGEGSCYIGSGSGCVLHLSDDLDSLDCFTVSDSGSEASVTAILEVGSDSLLVLDAANKRVHKLHKNGQNRRRLVSNLSQPADLKKDTNSNFYLVDKGLHKIGKFRSNGTLVFTRGGFGVDSLHFDSPEGTAVEGGLVYVADGGNNRIAVWDTSGNYKATVTGDFENPTAVWVTESGVIYLTDGNDGRLKGITPLGGNVYATGTTDSSKLKGLVPSENRHSLFSLASEPNNVYKLRIRGDDSMSGGVQAAGGVRLPKTLNLAQPFPNPARTRLNIAYALPRQTRVVLKLYDVAGKLVTTIANGEQKPGYYNLTWNRQDSKGRTCACGVYFCTLAAENQRFSRKVILTE